MITRGWDFHLPYFHNNSVYFQKLCGRVKKDYTERAQPNTINLHICCEHSQILPFPEVGLLVVSFQMCCPWISCWSEEVLNIWPQCISDLITDFFTLKPPGASHQVIKIAPTVWKAVTYKYLIMECISSHSVIDSNQQFFQTVCVLLNLDIPLNSCTGLLLQQDINNNGLGSCTQQSAAL